MSLALFLLFSSIGQEKGKRGKKGQTGEETEGGEEEGRSSKSVNNNTTHGEEANGGRP
jgi:hypothetical protein